jgi:DNA-binding winged helix-turn-helix (wHTH) protein
MRYRNNKLKTLGPQAAHLVVTLYEHYLHVILSASL